MLGTLCDIGKELEHSGPGICVFPLTSFSASHFIPLEDERVTCRMERRVEPRSSLLWMDQIPLNWHSLTDGSLRSCALAFIA